MQVSRVFFSSLEAEIYFFVVVSSPEAEKLPSLGRETKISYHYTKVNFNSMSAAWFLISWQLLAMTVNLCIT